MRATAQGWYIDPYEVHQDRYFSDGRPTELVRDDGAESYDSPPDDRPFPDADSLVEAPARGGQATDASDTRRADDVDRALPYTRGRGARVARYFQFYGKMRD
jgi:hypothetical protein